MNLDRIISGNKEMNKNAKCSLKRNGMELVLDFSIPLKSLACVAQKSRI
jgi:hypothetical protein